MKEKDVRPIDAALARLRSTYTPGRGRPSEDVEDPVELHDEEHDVPPAEELFWPPPGLEKIHGELPRLAADFAVGTIILLLTLIWLGFFAAEPRNAGNWGTVTALAIDVLLLMRAYARLRQLLFYAYVAVTQGYPRRLVWQVAADAQRDTALLLEGRGYYTGISKAEITRLSGWRITSAALALSGWLWIPLVFPLIAVLGFLGVLSNTLTWLALIGPALLLLMASALLRYRQWRARLPFRAPEVMEREVAAQASAWTQLFTALGLRRSRSRSTMELKLAMGGAWMAAFILLLPLGLAFITTVIPRFVGNTASVTPGFAPMNVLQRWRAPADPSITDVEAGHALQALRYAGQDANLASPLMQRPVRRYPALFDSQQFTGANNPEFWSDSLFKWVTRRALTGERRQMVESAAQHPAANEIRVLAGARSIDIPGTRWHLNAIDTVPVMRLPFTSNRTLREVAQSRVAAAALAYERGDAGEAQAILGEIISAGFLLRDEALDLSDALTGNSLLGIGARGLAALYEATGRTKDAADIRVTLAVAGAHMRETRNRGSLNAAYAYVLDSRNPRAGRWEVFTALQTAAPCLSIYNGIFGPTKQHSEWVERVRKSLVRTPSEQRYFRVMEKGMAAQKVEARARCTPRVLRTFRPILTGY